MADGTFTITRYQLLRLRDGGRKLNELVQQADLIQDEIGNIFADVVLVDCTPDDGCDVAIEAFTAELSPLAAIHAWRPARLRPLTRTT